VNCRNAEVSVFPFTPVAGPKRKFIEARLHWDTHYSELEAPIRELFDKYEVGDKRPIYVIVDPATGAEKVRFSGAPLRKDTIDNFVRFLESTVLQ
jgi:hypothetical protein